MKIKILTPNESGKFEFTKEELEALLKEVYDEGKSDASTLNMWPSGVRGLGGNGFTTTPYCGDVTYTNCDNSSDKSERQL